MKKIVILGGGGAGWLAAITIKQKFKNAHIYVVEDTTIPPIIAGEAGSANLLEIYKTNNINISTWIKAVKATPKHGSVYNDWNEVGKSFTQALVQTDQYGILEKVKYKSLVSCNAASTLLKLLYAKGKPIYKAYDRGILIDQNKARHNKTLPFAQGNKNEMYHFDSRANADFLKNIALERGITHIDNRYTNSVLDEFGNIQKIQFVDGTELESDWFFDCSGFARLLLVKTMGAEFEDTSHRFPATSVVAWWNEDNICKSYTELTAMKYGWSFNINLAGRSGNGYIYDDTETTLDEAIKEAEVRFGNPVKPVAKLKFKPGTVKQFWIKNVIGLGLSTGFSDPLESNGMGLVSMQLFDLYNYWNPEVNPIDTLTKKYNESLYGKVNDINDFISFHFTGKRTDTNYWIKMKDKTRFSDSLNNRLDLYREGIIVPDNDVGSLYGLSNWLQVAQGLDLINIEKLKKNLSYLGEDTIKLVDDYWREQLDVHPNITDTCYEVQEWIAKMHQNKT